MNLAEYSAYDGLGLAELIRRGETTPREIGRCVLAGVVVPHPEPCPRGGAFITPGDLVTHDLGARCAVAQRQRQPFVREVLRRRRHLA